MAKVTLKCPMCEGNFWVKDWRYSHLQKRTAPYGQCVSCKWTGFLEVKNG